MTPWPRFAALLVALVIVTSPFGGGGRAPLALLAHHTVLLLACLLLAWRAPQLLAPRRRLALWLLAFAAIAVWGSPYRFATLLVLADVGAAATLFALVAAIPARAPSPIVPAVMVAAATIAASGLLERARGGGSHGLIANPQYAACFVAAAGALLLARASRPAGTGRSRLGSVLGAVAALAFIQVIASRGALLGFAAAFALVLVGRGRGWRGALLVAALVGVAVVSPTPLGRRLRAGTAADLYAFQRIPIWRGSARMALDHLASGGVGLGSFRDAARRYNFAVEGGVARYGKFANIAHCEPLELLAEASLPGLALLLCPAAVALRRGRRLWRGSGEAAERALAAVAGVVALLAHSAVDGVLHTPANLYLLAALLGILAAVDDPKAAAVEPPPRRLAWPLPALIGVTLWAGAVVVPWAGDHAFQVYRRRGDGAWLERARRLVPGHAGYAAAAGERAGELFLDDGRLERLDAARRDLERAMRLQPLAYRHPARLAALEHRAVLDRLPALELGERALEHYRQALALDPFNPFLTADRAFLLGRLGRLDQAAAAAERAVALEPNFAAGWRLVARARRERGDAQGGAAAEGELARIARLADAVARDGTRYERDLVEGVILTDRPRAGEEPAAMEMQGQ